MIEWGNAQPHLSIHQNGITALPDNPGNAVVGHTKAIHQASVSLTGCHNVKCNGKSATRIDDLTVPGVKFLYPWTHPC